jgi:hypothetical protein
MFCFVLFCFVLFCFVLFRVIYIMIKGVAWRKLHPDEKRKYKAKAAALKEEAKHKQVEEKSVAELAPLYMALYEANIGLNTLSGHDPLNNI